MNLYLYVIILGNNFCKNYKKERFLVEKLLKNNICISYNITTVGNGVRTSERKILFLSGIKFIGLFIYVAQILDDVHVVDGRLL